MMQHCLAGPGVNYPLDVVEDGLVPVLGVEDLFIGSGLVLVAGGFFAFRRHGINKGSVLVKLAFRDRDRLFLLVSAV